MHFIFLVLIAIFICGCHVSEKKSTYTQIELDEEEISEIEDSPVTFSLNNTTMNLAGELSSIHNKQKDFPPIARQYTQLLNFYYYIDMDYKMKRINLLTNEEQDLFQERVNNFAVSDDNRYIYVGIINEEWYKEWELSDFKDLYSKNPFLYILVPQIYDIDKGEFVQIYCDDKKNELDFKFLKNIDDFMITTIKYNSENNTFEINYNIDSPVPMIAITYILDNHTAIIENKFYKEND